VTGRLDRMCGPPRRPQARQAHMHTHTASGEHGAANLALVDRAEGHRGSSDDESHDSKGGGGAQLVTVVLVAG
jgi:hypothetical protein